MNWEHYENFVNNLNLYPINNTGSWGIIVKELLNLFNEIFEISTPSMNILPKVESTVLEKFFSLKEKIIININKK